MTFRVTHILRIIMAFSINKNKFCTKLLQIKVPHWLLHLYIYTHMNQTVKENPLTAVWMPAAPVQ